jgi:hypothetical protein
MMAENCGAYFFSLSRTPSVPRPEHRCSLQSGAPRARPLSRAGFYGSSAGQHSCILRAGVGGIPSVSVKCTGSRCIEAHAILESPTVGARENGREPYEETGLSRSIVGDISRCSTWRGSPPRTCLHPPAGYGIRGVRSMWEHSCAGRQSLLRIATFRSVPSLLAVAAPSTISRPPANLCNTWTRRKVSRYARDRIKHLSRDGRF